MKPRQPTGVGRQGANSGQVRLHDKGTPFETLPSRKGLPVFRSRRLTLTPAQEPRPDAVLHQDAGLMAQLPLGGLPRERFRRRLAAGPILVDGALGTLLFSRGVPQRASLDELVESHPEMVGAVHREYLEAGAELIETCRSVRTGGGSQPGALRAASARSTGGPPSSRARRERLRAAMPSSAVPSGPLGPPGAGGPGRPEEVARATFREQIEGLLEGGVDLSSSKRARTWSELVLAVEEARRASDLPVMASMTFGEELCWRDGSSPAVAAEALIAAGVDAVGVNCGAGPAACLDALEAMGSPADGCSARSIMPNAGLSQRLEGQFVFAAGADVLRSGVPRVRWQPARASSAAAAGQRPTHIAAMREVLDRPSRARSEGRASGHGHRPANTGPAPAASGARPRTALVERAREARPPRSATADAPGRAARSAAGSSSASRSIRRGASGSSGRSRPRDCSATPASTSSTSLTARWRGCA